MIQKMGMLLSGAGLLVSWLYGDVWGLDLAWLAVVLCGLPIAWAAGKELLEEHSINSDVLVMDTIGRLRLHGVGEIAMLTGDNRGAASQIARQAGVTTVYAEQFPEAKYQRVEEYRQKGLVVGMVGDGINDAPALTAAHVGIAMGEGGTQIASEAADIVIMHDDVSKVADVVQLGQKTLRVIRENLMISSLINAAAVILAMVGTLGPVGGAFVHNATSVLVVLNSARLIHYLSSKN